MTSLLSTTELFPLAATRVRGKTPPAPCLTDEVEVDAFNHAAPFVVSCSRLSITAAHRPTTESLKQVSYCYQTAFPW